MKAFELGVGAVGGCFLYVFRAIFMNLMLTYELSSCVVICLGFVSVSVSSLVF